MKNLVVGNWKMHFNPHDTEVFVHKLNKLSIPSNVEAVLCPPFIDLQAAARAADSKKYKLGAQNCHPSDDGAFTGEVSAAMLAGLVDYVIVGHSERRAMGETDAIIAKKMAAAIRNGIKPILCVGERLDDRHDGHSKQVVVDQLNACFHDLTADEAGLVTIAYEPVWAIGTGETATPDQIAPIIKAIRSTVDHLYGEDVSESLRILYGGSVDAETTTQIMAVPGVNGLLVGGASLAAAKFDAILQASS